MTDGWAFGIKDDSKIGRLLFFFDLPEHGQETIDGVGGESLGRGETFDGIEGAVKERIAVYEKEFLFSHQNRLTKIFEWRRRIL